MLSRSEFARSNDGTSLNRELERLSRKGGGWVEVAAVLSRRINWTLDWEDLGPPGARYKVIGSRGEAVLLWDSLLKNQILKLRGREEHGYGSAGFGCILGRNVLGRVCYEPGTLAQAVERERLTWEEFGFACRVEDVLEGEAGLLLAQDFIVGCAPLEREIHAYMLSEGWESLNGCPEVSPVLQSHAWRRGDVGAFDANETNFIKADADGKIYPIDLIVWHWPA